MAIQIDVSIIFVNYKTPEMTRNAVQSVKEKSQGFSYEIIVVDNSNDESEFVYLKSLLPSEVQIYTSKGNIGFGKGNNLGASHAKGKYLYFINTDTLLINNAINELFSFSEKNYPCIAGSNIYSKEKKPYHSYIGYLRNAKNFKKDISLLSSILRHFRRNDFNYSSKPKALDGYVCGASLMLPKKIFDEIGGFDNDIFMYAEDCLLCYRLHKEKNIPIYNVPSSKIIHFEGGSEKKQSESHINRMIDGNKVYFCKAFSNREYLAFLKAMADSSKKKACLFGLLFNKKMHDNYTLQYHIYHQRYLKELKE